jgi:signal transduction histidine kinase
MRDSTTGGWRLERAGIGSGWLAACAGTLALTAATAAIGLDSSIVDRPVLFTGLRVVFCAGLAVVALAVLARGAGARMAAPMLAASYSLALAGLTAASSPLLFALGRIAVPLSILLSTYVVFAYPSGRVEQRGAARLLVGSAAAMAVLLAANLLVSDVEPVAGPFVRCSGSECPSNPLNIVAVGHGAGTALSTALAMVTALTLAGTAVLVAQRAAQATQLQRRSLAPLLTWAVLAALGYAFFLSVRAIDQDAPLLTPAAVATGAIIAAMPLAIGLGIVRGRVFAMGGLEHMVAALGDGSNLADLQQTMSRAFADPRLQLLLWQSPDGRYVDVDGAVVELAGIDPRRKVTQLHSGGDNLAAVVHDPMLSDQVLAASASAVRLALDNARLQRDLTASIAELAASRKRVAGAADEERRRIEQDLHDGAQQGLVALRINLALLAELAADDPESIAPALAEAGERVDKALDHIRSLAKGIYPSALRDLGLAYALGAVVRDLPLDIVMRADLNRRFATDVETAVYFCCVEALQNVAKHCGSGARVDLRASEEPWGLRFMIADDGPGFDQALITSTRGLTGMRDRLEAIGGELTIRSARGTGTTVTGRVPASLL